MSDLRTQKQQMRREMQKRREQASAENPRASFALRDRFLAGVKVSPCIVGYYKAMGSEMEPAPLVEALRQKGCSFALPAVVAKGQPLRFHRFIEGDDLLMSAVGVFEPVATAPVVEPDILLVPFLAFDRRLYRLGYGGGFYDRTLAALRPRKKITAIGIGFSRQEVTEVPAGEGDARLDKVVTEIQVFG